MITRINKKVFLTIVYPKLFILKISNKCLKKDEHEIAFVLIRLIN